MADCYPQGCPPCTEEISFPENPINGQRECFHIGKDPNTGEDILKCWVYDQCVPGWRAEGPAVAPINFKGQVDLTKTEAENSITAKEGGDYYIVAVASADITDVNGNVIKTAQQFLNDNWDSLQHEVNKGAFILWSGTEWLEIPRPCVGGEEADCALDVTPNPDNRESGVIVIASVEEVEEGTDKCKAVTPYTLQKGIKDSDLFDADCVDEDPENNPLFGPDNVAVFEYIQTEDDWRIGCRDLTLGTTQRYGVGKIAPAFSTDSESYGEGFDSDWLTNAAMAPIIEAIQERLTNLENNNPGPDVPADTVRVIKTYRNTNGAVGASLGDMNFTWTPVDAANLVNIDIIAAGGSGGAKCAGGFAPAPSGLGANSKYYIKEAIPESAHGNNLTITVGKPGRGNANSQNPPYPAGPGGNSSIPLVGMDDLVAPGADGAEGFNNTPVSGFDREQLTGVTAIYGGGRAPGQEGNACAGYGGGWGTHGQGGIVLVYEHYPLDWVDPRPKSINF